jgi:hypothetical protein
MPNKGQRVALGVGQNLGEYKLLNYLALASRLLEPASLSMLALGLLGLGVLSLKKLQTI